MYWPLFAWFCLIRSSFSLGPLPASIVQLPAQNLSSAPIPQTWTNIQDQGKWPPLLPATIDIPSHSEAQFSMTIFSHGTSVDARDKLEILAGLAYIAAVIHNGGDLRDIIPYTVLRRGPVTFEYIPALVFGDSPCVRREDL